MQDYFYLLNEIIKDENRYVYRVLEINYHLKDKNNPTFKEKIIRGDITPESLAVMDEINFINEQKKEEIIKKRKEDFYSKLSDLKKENIQVSEGLYKCRKCGSKKTIQKELQTRSADEPMTIFIICLECKNSWKI